MAYPKILDLSKSAEAPVLPALGKDSTTLQQARNVMVGGDWAGRRRKGFRISTLVDNTWTADTQTFSAEHVFGGIGGTTTRFFLIGHGSTASLYSQQALASLSSATTGFTAFQPAFFVPWADTMIVWTAAKRVVGYLNTGTITWDDLHIAAPSAASAAAAGAGTALPPGTHTYYICAYNSNRNVQSGPSAAFSVTLTSANNVSITGIPAIAGQVTGHKIYRTEPNGVVAKYVATTAGTTYTDSTVPANLSSTDILPRDVFGTAFTSAAPTPINTSNGGAIVLSYRGMLVAGGSTTGTTSSNPKRIYFTQPGFPDRWSDNYYVDVPCAGNITAMCVHGNQIIVATPQEIWSVYGSGTFGNGVVPLNDFVVERISGSHGIAGAKALRSLQNFAVGISTCGPIAIFPGKDSQNAVVPLKMPDMDRYIIPKENYPQGCIGYNPRRREIWFALPVRGETSTDENRRVLVYPIDELSKVAVYDLRISAFMESPGDNDFGTSATNIPGYDLYFSDWMGNHCQAEYSDGDGLLGNESYVVLGDTIASLGGSGNRTVTPTSATGFPGSNGLRGVKVVGIPASGTQEPEVRTVISNATGTFTLDEAWTNVAAGDKYFLGGILDDRITGKVYLTAEEGRIARSLVTKTQCFWSDVVGEEP